MLTEEHVNSAKSYVLGASAVILPPAVTSFLVTITPLLQFLTMLGGLVIIIMRGIYDYREHKKKNGSP